MNLPSSSELAAWVGRGRATCGSEGVVGEGPTTQTFLQSVTPIRFIGQDQGWQFILRLIFIATIYCDLTTPNIHGFNLYNCPDRGIISELRKLRFKGTKLLIAHNASD